MTAFHHRIRRICACIIGMVFLLAGMFKLLDPVGAGLVVEEYYKFFHLWFLIPTAKAVAVGLALLEALTGAMLISGIWRKLAAVLASAMILVFTVLTLILAIVNPPMDCGCFGEVIHLSNLGTFLKNLILLGLSLIAFLPFRDFGKNKTRKYVSFALSAAGILALTGYSLARLPLVDYTAFSPGAELLASRDNSIDVSDEYESTFVYEKNGQEGVFTLDQLPDSTWTYVRTETIRKKGLRNDNVPILSFTDSTGTYCDELATEDNVLVLSVYRPLKLKGDSWTKLADVMDAAANAGFKPLLLAAATPEGMDTLSVIVPDVRARLSSRLYFADFTTLISLNRSNGGATWFNEGQLITKYPLGKLPAADELLEMSGRDANEVMLDDSSRGRITYDALLLYVFAILLLW
jgi:uncharacterized membrane protein YphA (DoxX/SURF4 family)